MTLLKFTTLKTHPDYGFCNFPVFAAKIAIRAEDLREMCATYLKETHLNRAERRQHIGRYGEFARVTELHALLAEACANGSDITLEGNDIVWSFTPNLVFQKQFVSAACPKCAQRFPAENCQVQAWQFHNGYISSAGRRVVCPCEHTLFVRIGWHFD